MAASGAILPYMGNGVAGLQKHDLARKWREPRTRSGFEFDGHGEDSMVDSLSFERRYVEGTGLRPK